MSVQQSIFDQAEKSKQEGIELVYRHANTFWKKEAASTLLRVARKQEYFTSDDILIPLETRGVTTGDNRAIAAVLQSANRMGLITSTDRFIRCRRKSRHGAPIMVWRSNMQPERTEYDRDD
jgi:hypothetical protein